MLNLVTKKGKKEIRKKNRKEKKRRRKHTNNKGKGKQKKQCIFKKGLGFMYGKVHIILAFS